MSTGGFPTIGSCWGLNFGLTGGESLSYRSQSLRFLGLVPWSFSGYNTASASARSWAVMLLLTSGSSWISPVLSGNVPLLFGSVRLAAPGRGNLDGRLSSGLVFFFLFAKNFVRLSNSFSEASVKYFFTWSNVDYSCFGLGAVLTGVVTFFCLLSSLEGGPMTFFCSVILPKRSLGFGLVRNIIVVCQQQKASKIKNKIKTTKYENLQDQITIFVLRSVFCFGESRILRGPENPALPPSLSYPTSERSISFLLADNTTCTFALGIFIYLF